jgi:hypothetical protein
MWSFLLLAEYSCGKLESMTNNEKNENPQSALKEMVEKLDHRQPGSGGYVTHLPEIQRILSELTSLVPAVVLQRSSPGDAEGDVSVEIKIGFTIERSLL